MRLLPWLVLATVVAAGCHTVRNYPLPEGPRYAGGWEYRVESSRPQPLRIATFNIEYGRQIDSALVVLGGDPALRDLDVLLLQEMDAAGTKRIAAALDMRYVYYPASFRSLTRRDFGNAVLARWPISEDRKIVLPHVGRWARTLRTATAATVVVRGVPVRVYSVHLGTVANVTRAGRADQLGAILADAQAYPRAIIGGDLNDASIGRVAVAAGYAWPTEHGPFTTRGARLDHILLRGFPGVERSTSGTVAHIHHASDHRAVWVVTPPP